MKISGVYLIFNRANKKKYVGSSINVYRRFKEHKTGLSKNKHNNRFLQFAWNKYSEEKNERNP